MRSSSGVLATAPSGRVSMCCISSPPGARAHPASASRGARARPAATATASAAATSAMTTLQQTTTPSAPSMSSAGSPGKAKLIVASASGAYFADDAPTGYAGVVGWSLLQKQKVTSYE